MKGMNKGITLIALVVTIVVLLILATISIGLLTGNNGIINRAKDAKEDSEIAEEKETVEISAAQAAGKDKWGEITEDNLEEELTKNIGERDVDYKLAQKGNKFIITYIDSNRSYLVDADGKVAQTVIKEVDGVIIPDGFYYVGGTKEDGLVISDNKEDEGKGTSHDVAQTLKGNQFVWVPVDDPSTMFIEEPGIKLKGVTTTTDVYSKLRFRDSDFELEWVLGKPGNEEGVCEPDLASEYDTSSEYPEFYEEILGYNYIQDILGYTSAQEMAEALVKEYKGIYDSIKTYNGFYIGRYELSGNIDNPTVKAGEVLSEINWYESKKACMNIIKGNDSVKSTMIYGCQWDETMYWLKNTIFKGQEEKVDDNSSSWGNYAYETIESEEDYLNIKVAPAGSKEEWSANHIYDLAGNCFEWTQENTSMVRILRGRIC